MTKDWCARKAAIETGEDISVGNAASKHAALMARLDGMYRKINFSLRLDIYLCYYYTVMVPTCVTFHLWFGAIVSLVVWMLVLYQLPKMVKTKQDILDLRKQVEKMHEDLLTNWTYDGKVN